MAETPDPSNVEKISAWLEEQGFWLQHHTQGTLQRNGAQASLGRVYRDPQSGKLRDIDVLSDPLLTFAPLNLRHGLLYSKLSARHTAPYRSRRDRRSFILWS